MMSLYENDELLIIIWYVK